MNWSKIAFWICLGVSATLIVAGFIVPPTGIIDGSVLTAVGELLGFAALAVGAKALHDGQSLKLTHGTTTLEVNTDDDDKNDIIPNSEEIL